MHSNRPSAALMTSMLSSHTQCNHHFVIDGKTPDSSVCSQDAAPCLPMIQHIAMIFSSSCIHAELGLCKHTMVAIALQESLHLDGLSDTLIKT